ncbi:MAG: protein phosphatase 2C domain-containing protein [Propionicimonas sp.]|uniref:PP2C family serine/threonine-protein phosphatase n=1 Tax=Propionicimonas sp. TaxID=1955623 RepID=UPI003D0B0F3C
MSEPTWPTMPPPPGQPEQPAPDPAPSAVAPVAPTCPQCGRPIDPAAWYCEACGNPLIPTVAPAPPTQPADAPSGQTRRLGVRASQLTTCPSCGGNVGADGYCQTCGAKAPSPRDHFSEAPAAWVAGVCDRGVQHHRNEDAMALWADGDRAVLVVCDGVSTSVDSDVAAMAAARTARDELVTGTADLAGDDDAGVAAALVAAVARANDAVVATTAADSTNAASATFAAAVVVGDRIHYANLGDSRVYLLGAQQHLLLSLDDSMAQAFIAEGMPREEAEALPRAHAITKWLGRDSLDIVPRTGTLQVPEPGWLVVCSDGLWNYASSADELAAQLDAATTPGDEPGKVAQRLVDWATSCGGHDNITVALARVPTPSPQAPDPSDDPASLVGEATNPENGVHPDHG